MASDYKNYALALFELAKEENKTDSFFEEITEIDKILAENKDYFKIFSSPVVSADEKTALINEAFKEIEPTLKKFMLLLAANGALNVFSCAAKGFSELYYEDKGIVLAEVRSARRLTSEETEKIADQLSKITGKKAELTNIVDETLLGGAILSYNGREFDGSLKSKLIELKKNLIS